MATRRERERAEASFQLESIQETELNRKGVGGCSPELGQQILTL